MTVRGFPFAAAETPPDSQMLAQAWQPWFETIVSLFGAERCMFASNFPVDSLCARFDQIYDGFATIVQDFAAAEKRALFHDNAVRIYAIT